MKKFQKNSILVIVSILVMSLFFACSPKDEDGPNEDGPSDNTFAKPTAKVMVTDGNSFTEVTDLTGLKLASNHFVVLECATSGATIKYSLGKDVEPTNQYEFGARGLAGLLICPHMEDGVLTINAIAEKDGKKSEKSVFTFNVTKIPMTPTSVTCADSTSKPGEGIVVTWEVPAPDQYHCEPVAWLLLWSTEGTEKKQFDYVMNGASRTFEVSIGKDSNGNLSGVNVQPETTYDVSIFGVSADSNFSGMKSAEPFTTCAKP